MSNVNSSFKIWTIFFVHETKYMIRRKYLKIENSIKVKKSWLKKKLKVWRLIKCVKIKCAFRIVIRDVSVQWRYFDVIFLLYNNVEWCFDSSSIDRINHKLKMKIVERWQYPRCPPIKTCKIRIDDVSFIGNKVEFKTARECDVDNSSIYRWQHYI